MQKHRDYTVHHNYHSPASITATLTHALSDIFGCDVREMETLVGKHVDPDALDRLFMAEHRAQVVLNFPSCQAVLFGNGHITIYA